MKVPVFLKNRINFFGGILFNRYVLALFLFTCWMLFFDKHRLFTQMALSRTVTELEENGAYYRESIEDAKVELKDFQKNKEQYAREKYLMHRDNEDVYIIDESKLIEENQER